MSEEKEQSRDVVISHRVTEKVTVPNSKSDKDAKAQAHKSASGKGKEDVQTHRSEPTKDK